MSSRTSSYSSSKLTDKNQFIRAIHYKNFNLLYGIPLNTVCFEYKF